MEAAKEQSGPYRFNQSLGRRYSAPQDRIMAIATMARTVSGKGRRRKKGPWDHSLRSGLRAVWGVFAAQDRRTMQAVKRV